MNEPPEIKSPLSPPWLAATEPEPQTSSHREFPYHIPPIHIILFLATGLTTLTAGAMQQGVIPWETPWQLYKGLPFSLSLLLILLFHEMGHYLLARYHRLDVSLPYFLPAPPIPFLIGTLGAFIRIRSPILNKPALLDVGAAGPLCGVLAALPVLVFGLQLSEIKIMPTGAGELEGIILGESLLFKFMCWLTLGSLPDTHHIVMHPMAFAGWIGLLVTNINLIPVGQLDGGHVSYALFGDRSQQIAKIFYGALILCGLVAWYGWLFWAILLLFLGFVHPPPLHYWIPLDKKRRVIGYITIAVFLLTFMPAPFQIHF
ncbi:MAG: site-2 protease family protein [Deltaproteobacteria bacterium]|nr:site-2 protease family protein [Deltaproteobacteria bacterium]